MRFDDHDLLYSLGLIFLGHAAALLIIIRTMGG